jgi:hypothetical protein
MNFNAIDRFQRIELGVAKFYTPPHKAAPEHEGDPQCHAAGGLGTISDDMYHIHTQ